MPGLRGVVRIWAGITVEFRRIDNSAGALEANMLRKKRTQPANVVC